MRQKRIMKRKVKQWWSSSIPPISTKRSITSHLSWTLYLLIVNSLDIASYKNIKNMFLHYTMLFKRLSSYLIIRLAHNLQTVKW